MGSCTSTLQKENIAIIPLQTPFLNASSIVNSVIKEEEEEEPQYDTHISNEELIIASFNRTLFCEDIVYEYKMRCNILDSFRESIVPEWSVRLTVENITDFYASTFEQYDATDYGKTIPFQFGKVMKPKVFTSLFNNILHCANILKDDNTFFSDSTADFLCIPYDIRCILQYNPEKYICDPRSVDSFKYYSVICKYNDKYKFLCHNTIQYKPKDQHDITSYSYWVRSLQHKIDFLFTITSRNVFMVIMNDLAFNFVQILKENFDVDDLLAWIIADYLPKHLVFNHSDERCNAQVLYKYDPSDEPFDDDEEYGVFYLNVIGNKLLKRHGIDADELHDFCGKMRDEHTSIPNEMTPSVSEDMLSITKVYESILSECDTSYYSEKKEIEEKSYQSTVSQYMALHNDVDRSDIDEDKFRVFFSTFIDEDGEDDINMFQWMTSLKKLNINLTEREIVDAFNFMCDEEENEGYIDFVDFTNFCQLNVDDNLCHNIRRTQQLLNSFIL